MIVIVDYGLGNLRSVSYKLDKYKVPNMVSSNIEDIDNASKLILPGVGSFGKGMQNIRERNLLDILNKKALQDKIPVLGICLGMQLLTKHSEEGDVTGLGWIDANTRKFSFEDKKIKIPQMGWNTAELTRDNWFTSKVDSTRHFYFVHSYYVECNDKQDSLGETDYGKRFTSIIQRDNIYGTQFHPEKSHRFGVEMLINFCKH